MFWLQKYGSADFSFYFLLISQVLLELLQDLYICLNKLARYWFVFQTTIDVEIGVRWVPKSVGSIIEFKSRRRFEEAASRTDAEADREVDHVEGVGSAPPAEHHSPPLHADDTTTPSHNIGLIHNN